MASVNGVLSPTPQHSDFQGANNDAITLSAKRKREESTDAQNTANGTSDSKSPEQTAASIEENRSLVRDLVDVLKTYDTIPSILNHPLPERVSSEPQAKRHKAEDGSETQSSTTSSIITRQSSNVYTDLDDILKDVDAAVSALTEKLQLPNGSELSTKISVFKKRAHQLVTREKAASSKSKANGAASTSKVNGNLSVKASTEINVGASNSKTVLTLYGNAPQPKQLFSSFQAEDVNGETKDLMETLKRAPLPPGISTTDIVAIPFNNLVEDKKRSTFGDAFPTPPNVPALQPPKPSKVANTRSSTVGWYQPATVEPHRRTGTYFTQNVTPGVWLDYSNASPPQASKRKQRAMSLGGAKAPQIEAEPAESEAAKLEAAFRSAYSGFAPTKDDSAAVAPTGLLDRIWWQQVGKKNYERMVEAFEPESADTVDGAELEVKPVIDADEELRQFEELVENWEDDTVDPTRLPVEARYEKSFEEKTLDEILEGTSELLETLSSFQRKRHMTLNPSNRPAGLLSAPDTTSLGTPTKPTDSEQNTYEIIRAQLKMMIENLPPYAVAKLNGDQLADLNISTKIEIHLDDYKGVLEDDELARPKMPASSATASRTAPSSLHRSTSSALYGNQYSASRPPTAGAHQYYGGAASTPVRATPNIPRAPATVQAPYQAPRPTGPPYRPQGYATPSFQQHAPRPSQHQYPQTSGGQYMQTPTAQSYMRSGNQGYPGGVPQSAPPAQMNGRYPSQPTYPHQAQGQNGIDYHRYQNGSQVPRQSSPPNPMYAQGSQATAAQHHPSYPAHGTPTPGMSQDRRPYLQNAGTNGSTPSAGQTQYTQSRSQPTGYSTFMTQEQQTLLLDRQRAQLANQQQARAAAQAAQAALQNGAPSTPTPQVNGGNAVAAGL